MILKIYLRIFTACPTYAVARLKKVVKKMKNRFNDACTALCTALYPRVFAVPDDIKERAQEIRLRVNRPVSICCGRENYYITSDGSVTNAASEQPMLRAVKADIMETFQNICNYSIYSKQNEIRNGFVTMQGGHRAGICGTAVADDGIITNIRDITSINIRIASERPGCANEILARVGTEFNGLLICGAPCSGKTTLIRDIARTLSLQNYNTAVIDERGEIAACTAGKMQNDIGLCDILDGYPKSAGITQAIRCLAPDFIICDEIGSARDAAAIEQGLHSGVRFAATVHCSDAKELLQKENIAKLIGKGFDKTVFLKSRKNAGKAEIIFDSPQELLNA